MEKSKLSLVPFVRQYGIAIFFGLLGILFVTIGLFQTFSSSPEEIVFDEVEEKDIFVDVSGAVINPNVYKLQSRSRLQDAVISAGGLSADADREYVEKTMNMARNVDDGEKVYIPYVGETTLSQDSEGQSNSVVLGVEESSEGLVNLNTASQAELDALPGVGPVTIEKIVDARPYAAVDELLSKDVLGEAQYGKVKDLVSVR